jgi:DNA-binding transcriptional regulator GbsR (MarR family)
MKTNSPTLPWLDARRKFVEAGGHTTQSFGLGRIIGQIYALLYLSPAPMCLDDIASELDVSKASVSTTVRQLERWAAVKRVWVRGDRRDYYEAETDFHAVLRHGLLSTMRKKLETAGGQLTHVEATLKQAQSKNNGAGDEQMQVVAERLARAKQFQTKLHELLTNPLIDHLL